MQSPHPAKLDIRLTKTFVSVLLALLAVYGFWLLTFWPGVLGEDSLAVMLQVEGNIPLQSGKPVFWYMFVKYLYGTTLRVECAVGVQMLICAGVFARILSWCWSEGLKKTFWAVIFLVALAPNVVYFQSSLYADGLFSVALTGFLFEMWLVSRRGRIGLLSLAYMVMLLPFAMFLRGNGVALVLSVFAVWAFLSRADRLKVVVLFAVWIALNAWANGHFKVRNHGVLYPLALFETVNFLQPTPMNLRPTANRVTAKTVEALTNTGQPLAKIVGSYDRDYWDTLIYSPHGPMLDIGKKSEKTVVKEFFRTNLWRNIPAFVSSRVNIFLVSFFGMGGFPSVYGAEYYLPRTTSESRVRPFDTGGLGAVLNRMFQFSFENRWICWTPLPGMLLALALFRSAILRRDRRVFWITAPLVAQLGGIFLFSIAGEYRYLLPFYVSTALLLPILSVTRRERACAAPAA